MTLALQKILADHERWLTSGGRLGNRANLSRWNLCGEDLRGLDLTGAILYRADLRGAKLAGSMLCHANLSQAVLTGADLRDVDLARANLRGTIFAGVLNLDKVRNFWFAPHASSTLTRPVIQPPHLD
jgi:hypothetical protein